MRYILPGMEITMGLALRKEDFENVFVAPPAPDLAAIMDVIDSVKEFQRLISAHETNVQQWRDAMHRNLVAGLDGIRAAASDVPASVAADAMLPLIDDGLSEIDRNMAWYEKPVEEMAEFSPVYEKMKVLTGGARRFFRKQLDRIEVLKTRQHAALLEMREIIVAFRKEIADDAEFEKWSRTSIARYPVVNEYLGR